MKATFLCGLDQKAMRRVPASQVDNPFTLRVGRGDGNIDLAVTNGSRHQAQLSSRAQDLVEIAAYLYQSDRLVARDTDVWTRDLDYHVAVRDLERWRQLAPLLNRIASFLSSDRIKFHFYAKREATTWIQKVPVPEGDFAGACLYSGGMDSSSGISWLMEKQLRVVAVTQYSNRLIDRSSLLRDLGAAGGLEMPLVGFRLVPKHKGVTTGPSGIRIEGLKETDNTWRLRTFFYLSISAVTADALGLNRLYMFENGILAHNLPFDAFVIGARSTRHAHPTFLELSQELFGKLFEREMKILNPFQFSTKGREALPLAKLTGMFLDDPSLIARTNSCWYFPNMVARLAHSSKRKITHCGGCMPCKIRRLGVYEADLDARESVENQYFIDPLGNSVFPEVYSSRPTIEKFAFDLHNRNILRLRRYVKRILDCHNLKEFSREWPQVFDFNGKNLTEQPVSSVINSIYDLYKKFAQHFDSLNVDSQ
jgi:7-cyano-7-deazaguanine synthase in queuosine biosynthesis